jgi:hypothetical protein
MMRTAAAYTPPPRDNLYAMPPVTTLRLLHLLSRLSLALLFAAPLRAATERLHWQAPPDHVRIVQRAGETQFLNIHSPGQNYDELRFTVKISAELGRTYLHADLQTTPERDDRITAPYVRLLTTNFVEFAMLPLTNATFWSTGEVIARSMRVPFLPLNYYVACGFGAYFDAMYPHMQSAARETIFDATTGQIIHRGPLTNAQVYTAKLDHASGVMFLGDTLHARILTGAGGSTTGTPVDLDYEVYDIQSGRSVGTGNDMRELVLRPKQMGNFLVYLTVGRESLVLWRTMQHIVVLPALEWTSDPGYLGRMVINDAVACGLSNDYHVFEDGRIDTALGDQIISERLPGSTITNFADGAARIITHDRGFFSYVIGSRLKWNMPYLLEIQYPEDAPRTYAFVLGNGTYAPAVHTGHTLGQPEPRFFADQVMFPLSRGMHRARFLVWAGDEAVRRGLYVGVADPGARNAPFSKKPLVISISLYQLYTLARMRPNTTVPAHLQRYAWVESDEPLPTDNVAFSPHGNAMLYGLNAIAPGALAWNGNALHNSIVMFPCARYRQPLRQIVDGIEYATDRDEDAASQFNFMAQYTALARQLKLAVVPRFEYGGSDDLPAAARAVAANGEPYPPQRPRPTMPPVADAVDVTHTATLADATAVLRDLIAAVPVENRDVLGPLIVRRRADFLSVSFSPAAIAAFAQETGTTLTGAGDDERRAMLVKRHLPAYRAWYQRRMLAFVRALDGVYRQQLPHVSTPALYYHWRSWGMPFQGLYFETEDDWAARWSKVRRLPLEGFPLPIITDQKLLAAIPRWTDTEEGLATNLLAQAGLTCVLPVYGTHATACAPYLTLAAPHTSAVKIAPPIAAPTQIARKDRAPLFAGQTMYHSREFSMYEPLLAFCTANPRCLVFDQSHQPCFPFPDYTRRFLANFLALPAIPMQRVPQSGNATPLYVQVGHLGSNVYVAVANPTFLPVEAKVFIPDVRAKAIIPLVGAARQLPFFVRDDGVTLSIALDTLELYSLRVEQ